MSIAGTHTVFLQVHLLDDGIDVDFLVGLMPMSNIHVHVIQVQAYERLFLHVQHAQAASKSSLPIPDGACIAQRGASASNMSIGLSIASDCSYQQP